MQPHHSSHEGAYCNNAEQVPRDAVGVDVGHGERPGEARDALQAGCAACELGRKCVVDGECAAAHAARQRRAAPALGCAPQLLDQRPLARPHHFSDDAVEGLDFVEGGPGGAPLGPRHLRRDELACEEARPVRAVLAEAVSVLQAQRPQNQRRRCMCTQTHDRMQASSDDSRAMVFG